MLLKIFYKSVVVSALFFAVKCWCGGIRAGEASRLNKLVMKAIFVVGLELDGPETRILENHSHPLHDELRQRIQPLDHPTEGQNTAIRWPFEPAAIRLYNSSGDHSLRLYTTHIC